MAAIAANHSPVSDQSLGRNQLETRFLWGIRRLRPPVRPRMPTWDLSVVLEALSKAPIEPLEEVPLIFLTVKTVFILTISSLKRVSDLQALSVAPSCLVFAPGMAPQLFLPKLCRFTLGRDLLVRWRGQSSNATRVPERERPRLRM